MVFPFGLEAMPEVRGAAGAGDATPGPPGKDPQLVFANRGLEPIYQPQRVLRVFAAMAAARPGLRLVVANDGSLRKVMQAQAQALGLGDAVRFVGRLDAEAQAGWYARAQWYLSLPRSDSVAVSVLEAMAHGCIPLLSDLPANRELVRHGDNGLIVADDGAPDAAALQAVQARAADIARDNRAWVQAHALFAPAVRAFVERLRSFDRA
jgi:glycosyltransferase involved in cell wall biosynthesis